MLKFLNFFNIFITNYLKFLKMSLVFKKCFQVFFFEPNFFDAMEILSGVPPPQPKSKLYDNHSHNNVNIYKFLKQEAKTFANILMVFLKYYSVS